MISLMSILGSHVFVWLFYQDQYENVRALFPVANIGQVFFFLSNTVMIVVLRFASEKYQLLLGAIYVVLFFAAVLPLIWFYGLWGAAWGLLFVNVLKFALISAFGFIALSK